MDREGSVDRETESQLRGVRRAQKRSKRGGKLDATAGSSVVETPANPAVEPTPLHDEDSATGKSNFNY